ncbi:cell wall-binding protein [Oribacterium asaccharolyticum]|uniref:cell wall-binding protein n=1 Tax=Oribacterium asaccharolyticum TaxID=1501332 RepID=UPI0028F09633|nr:cell wall-binding protein [Oribacterium asaccharolyticum]
MKKFVTLILVSFTLLFCFSFAIFAAEREATGEEISAVKSGQSSAYSWEDSENHWKLLYLDTKEKAWKYAKDRWVQIGHRFYFFDANGNAMEGWFQDEGKWYFAEYDNLKRNNDNAGLVLMGWASIPDEKGKNQTYYFTTDESGRPSGILQGTAGKYDAFTVDGQQVYFDELGHADMRSVSASVPKFAGKRT